MENDGAKLYRLMNQQGGWSNAKVTVLEEYPCESDEQAKAREKYWVDLQLEACCDVAFTPEERETFKKQYGDEYFLDSRCAFAEPKESKPVSKEHANAIAKKYYENHKVKILANSKAQYSEKRQKLLDYQKQYRVGQRLTKYKEYQREYKEKKRKKIENELSMLKDNNL
jgi:hypothetical protein